jgi:hypothetical protein
VILVTRSSHSARMRLYARRSLKFPVGTNRENTQCRAECWTPLLLVLVAEANGNDSYPKPNSGMSYDRLCIVIVVLRFSQAISSSSTDFRLRRFFKVIGSADHAVEKVQIHQKCSFHHSCLARSCLSVKHRVPAQAFSPSHH